MEVSEHIDALRAEGELMAKAAATAGADAAVPTCPDWTMRDLVRHTGVVHRWATVHVAEARTSPAETVEEALGDGPDDASLVDWFREGHAALVDALSSVVRTLVAALLSRKSVPTVRADRPRPVALKVTPVMFRVDRPVSLKTSFSVSPLSRLIPPQKPWLCR